MFEQIILWKYFQTKQEFGTDITYLIENVNIHIANTDDDFNEVTIKVEYLRHGRSATIEIAYEDIREYRFFSEQEKQEYEKLVLNGEYEEHLEKSKIERIEEYCEFANQFISEEEGYIFQDAKSKEELFKLDLLANCDVLPDNTFMKLESEDGAEWSICTYDRWQNAISDIFSEHEATSIPRFIDVEPHNAKVFEAGYYYKVEGGTFYGIRSLEVWIFVEDNDSDWFHLFHAPTA